MPGCVCSGPTIQLRKSPPRTSNCLARAGTRFTDAHSSSGVCTPSNYALLHGRYHWRKFHGIVQSFDQPILDAERTTLAELLRGRSHATAAFGKWHLGWDWEAIRRTGAKPRVEGKNKIYAAADFDWRRKLPGGGRHIAPGDRAALGVRMGNHRRRDRIGAAAPIPHHRLRPLHDAPAIISPSARRGRSSPTIDPRAGPRGARLGFRRENRSQKERHQQQPTGHGKKQGAHGIPTG